MGDKTSPPQDVTERDQKRANEVFVVLKADIRERLGVPGGSALLVAQLPDGVVLRTTEESIAYAQAVARRYTADKPEASVDAFLAGRRADTGE